MWVQEMLQGWHFFKSRWKFQSKPKVFKALLWDVLPRILFDSCFSRVVYSEYRSSRLLRNVGDFYQATQLHKFEDCSRQSQSFKSHKDNWIVCVRMYLWLCQKAVQETESANIIGMTPYYLNARRSAEYGSNFDSYKLQALWTHRSTAF